MRDQFYHLIFGGPEVGFLATWFFLVRFFQPARKIRGGVVEQSRRKLPATCQVSEVGPRGCLGAGSADGVTVGARLREEKVPAGLGGFGKRIFRRPRLLCTPELELCFRLGDDDETHPGALTSPKL